MHIRNMKDITELTLVINPNHKKELQPVTMLNGTSTVAGTEDGSPYHCPITGLEMNGRYRFVFFLTCGCVVSERAYQNVTDGMCPKCGTAYGKTDCVDINPVAEERKTRAKENMEDRRLRLKEAKRDAKLREKVGDAGDVSKEDHIAAWLSTANADRRGSSSSSVDTGISDTRRLSMVSALSAGGSIGEAEDKQARKRRLEAWAKEERRKSLGDEEKAKKIRLIKEQLLKKKRALIAARINEESSDSSDSSDCSSDSD
ncbi:Oidioi.mRNA.OKI2018_I69.chr2.g8278.t1.cds [Oikopleura dioica]|uniref:Replication termination factor 2 n=1 Tax=Oikopleura dioica TaxID=34765 RepID=A0ABN7TEF5_OIKDI|nr:Oidioi.mRNA.OKI2018_I69.chr2.g8278.t1.cds [Oikopleura dioica]